MVESVIVLPMVLFTVFFMIYFGLFKLQEMAILYQVQRAAHQGSMVMANPGYKTLGDYSTKKIDFASSPEEVDEYYKAHHDGLKVLYREIFGCSEWADEGEMQDYLDEIGQDTMILAGVSLFDSSVEIKRSLFSTKIETQVYFGFPTPGVLKYFGFGDEIKFLQGASAVAVNPAGFVRSTDLAGDAIVVVSEKLGIMDDLDKILDGIKEYLF